MNRSTAPDWEIHFTPEFKPAPDIRHAVFDFDGTLSLVRGGWAEIMTDLFLEHLPRREDDVEETLRHWVFDEVLALNGKPTIYQMQLLERLVTERGGQADTPANYNAEFQRRLKATITGRLASMADQTAAPDQYLVFNARAMLTALKKAGIVTHLLSGTTHADLLIETRALGISDFLEDRIYGPDSLHPGFTKHAVFERLVRENDLKPGELLCFGDGAVEIQDTRHFGGLAIAVASTESANGSGKVDPIKRRHLLGAGAQVVIPDYRRAPELLNILRSGQAA